MSPEVDELASSGAPATSAAFDVRYTQWSITAPIKQMPRIWIVAIICTSLGRHRNPMHSMIVHLFDPANSVTALGILCSGAGVGLAVSGNYEAGIALGLWAIIADDVDGAIARRAVNRTTVTKAIGKSLDGFSDLIFGSVIPAIVIASVINSAASGIFAAYLLLIGALRLAYFDYFGLSDQGRSTGLPLSYDLPVLATTFLIHRFVAPFELSVVLPAIFGPLALLHIAPFKIKASGTLVHVFTITIAAIESIGLLTASVARA